MVRHFIIVIIIVIIIVSSSLSFVCLQTRNLENVHLFTLIISLIQQLSAA